VSWKGLLVSVRNADEATEALAGGSAIVDVKDPLAGPLGAAVPATVAAIARRVGSAVPWTLAGGELLDCGADAEAGGARLLRFIDDVLAALDSLPAPAAVKIGLSAGVDAPWCETLARLAPALPRRIGLVAVAYADWQGCAAPEPERVFSAAAGAGCRGLLVDTFDKLGPGLFRLVDRATIRRWVAHARAVGLPLGLAGKLSLDDVALAASLGADVVGVRSVACMAGGLGRGEGDRLGIVERDRVRRAVERFQAASGGEEW